MRPWMEREQALWDEHYGALAGWVLACTGDRTAAREIADEAFVRVFARYRLPREPRRRLYAEALALVDAWLLTHTEAAPRAPGVAWVAIADLGPRTRRCVLLHHAGLSEAETARVLHLRSARAVHKLLVLAGLQRSSGPVPGVIDMGGRRTQQRKDAGRSDASQRGSEGPKAADELGA